MTFQQAADDGKDGKKVPNPGCDCHVLAFVPTHQLINCIHLSSQGQIYPLLDGNI